MKLRDRRKCPEQQQDAKPPPLSLKTLVLAPSVLIVGDGDFSFSQAVCRLRSSSSVAGQLVCTSFDSSAQVVSKYPEAQAHLAAIQKYPNVTVRHRIDATKLAAKFASTRYDRVVFNFPHTGQQRVHLNRAMVGGFLASAKQVLATGGVVLVTLKDRPPYSLWDLSALAADAGLVMRAKVPFREGDFAGYAHQTTDPGSKSLTLRPYTTQTYIFGAAQ